MDVKSTKFAIIEKVIQTNDEDLLNEVQAILEEGDIDLTSWQKEELDKRASRHKTGESKSFTWEEVKKQARSGNEL